jgi:hypothetical protein
MHSLQMRKIVISTFLFPIFDYVAAVFIDSVNEIALQRAENACTRFVFNLPVDSHISPTYERLGWMKIK